MLILVIKTSFFKISSMIVEWFVVHSWKWSFEIFNSIYYKECHDFPVTSQITTSQISEPPFKSLGKH